MLRKVVRALSQRREALASRPQAEEPPDGDAVFRQGLAMALGLEEADALLAELDYRERVRRQERLLEIRRRELVVRREIESLG